jgi:hypothetical protein
MCSNSVFVKTAPVMVMAEKIAHAAIYKILIPLECPNEVNKKKKIEGKAP